MPSDHPACGGQTHLLGLRVGTITDHPRVRGTDIIYRVDPTETPGSPPRAGDILHLYIEMHPLAEIIPACGGQTRGLAEYRSDIPDHPRVRGTDRVRNLFPGYLPGSPPRAGDRRDLHVHHDARLRITPACGAQTGSAARRSRRPPDHPRVRGTDEHIPDGFPIDNGSPPRAGGQTASLLTTRRSRADHPRARGTDLASRKAMASRYRSPRARGTDTLFEAEVAYELGSPPRAGDRRATVVTV